MAMRLFNRLQLTAKGIAHNIRERKKMVERLSPEVVGCAEEVMKDGPVVLNRAPTLHRLGIQAFEPIACRR